MTLKDASKSLGIRWNDGALYLIDDEQHLYFDFPINPSDFLSFAEKDIASPNEAQGLVNCLTNSKRAIDSQVDRVLSALGFSIRRKSFKSRFEILRDIGIVAPRIIRKVRDIRNKLEHEYRRPERKDVEDALDIATLFVSATDRVFLLFPLTVYIYNPEDEHEDSTRLPINFLKLRFKEEEDSPFFEVDVCRNSETETTFGIHLKDHFYIPLIKYFTALQREINVSEISREIDDLINQN
jgi:hypothetical protein